MDRTADLPLNDLRRLINDLGKDGGLMGPSVYDTAQVLRMAPPAEGVRPALEWLLTRQHTDGGWGNPAVPRSRDVPTLAAILALHTYSASERDRQAIQAGLAFLQRQAEHWAGTLPDDLPVGVELILPQLLDEAAAAGLKVSRAPYQALIALGMRRRRMLASLPLQPGTTPVHAWEAWGRGPDPALLDAPGSIDRHRHSRRGPNCLADHAL
jgi:halimadienyl-diphosphate synthase